MLLIAHVSDTHFDGSVRAESRALQVVDYLNSLVRRVDVVVVTGDVADNGLDTDYAQARAVFGALRAPVYLLPGNHDRRAPFRSFLGDDDAGPSAGGDAPINRVVQLGGATFALCDSTIPGRDDGYLADATLTWLAQVADATDVDAPLFVCFHHPPVPLHSALLDPIRQHGEDRLATALEGRRGRTFVLCGHAHTPAATIFAGLPLIIGPGVTSTLVLPWEPSPDTLDYDRPPALAMHVLDEAGRLTTHYRALS